MYIYKFNCFCYCRFLNSFSILVSQFVAKSRKGNTWLSKVDGWQSGISGLAALGGRILAGRAAGGGRCISLAGSRRVRERCTNRAGSIAIVLEIITFD